MEEATTEGATATATETVASYLTHNHFKLGGSRYMANKFPTAGITIGPETDYDFYATDTESARAFLTKNGFTEVKCHYRDYWDDMLVSIWKNYTFPRIDVLLRHDEYKYKQAFDLIGSEMYINYIWKSSPKRDPNIPERQFKIGVKDFLNSLFKLVGFVPPTVPDEKVEKANENVYVKSNGSYPWGGWKSETVLVPVIAEPKPEPEELFLDVPF